MSSPTPPVVLELGDSRLRRHGLRTLWLAGVCAALDSALPGALRLALLLTLALALQSAAADARRRGCRRLEVAAQGERGLRLRAWHADGRVLEAPLAGHAFLGTWALFLFPAGGGRITVLRDAATEDDFRRLRARLRLA